MLNLTGGIRYAVVAAAVLLVVGVSAWGGYRVAHADCADRELEVARAYLSNQNAAVEFTRQQSEKTSRRITAVRSERAEALSRVGELERALANLPRRADADWNTDELRTLTALHDAYSADRRSELPDALREDAGAIQPAIQLRSGADALGLKLQQPAR